MDHLPATPSSPPPSVARAHFHLALAGIFVPPLGLVLTLCLAVANKIRVGRTDLDRVWTIRLFLLFLADLVVLFCAAVNFTSAEKAQGLSGPLGVKSEPSEQAEAPLRIGIEFDSGSSEPRVGRVWPGTPADRAGLKAGDRILKIDGSEIETSLQMRETIERGREGVSRRLEIARGPERLGVDVTPEALRRSRARGLMETQAVKGGLPWAGMALSWLASLILVGAASQIAALRRGGPRVVVWRVVALALGASMAAAVGALLAARALMGGWSLFGILLAMTLQGLVLLLVSAVSLRRLPPVPAPPGPFLSPGRATLMALYYLITGNFRVAIVLFAIARLVGYERSSDAIHTLTRAMPGALGIGLILIQVVFLAPVAEELLFRGILLPRLAAQLGSAWALWSSALLFASLHIHYGLFMALILYYGLILGWARLRSGGLKSPILLHMLINGVAMGAYFLTR